MPATWVSANGEPVETTEMGKMSVDLPTYVEMKNL